MINKKEDIASRLEIFIQSKGWSKADFARAVDIHPQNVNRYLKGSSDPRKIIINLIPHGLNPEWARTGKGEMYKDEAEFKSYSKAVQRVQKQHSGGLARKGSELYAMPPEKGMTMALGSKMCVEGIEEGDLLVLDDEATPKPGDLILKLENDVPAISPFKEGQTNIVAVVIRLIRDLRKK
ncbi:MULTISPECIES: helix-turn-helix domain-containing protein [unclassified Prosthecochloris]|uniref:helix-turn-helix domain-containing protein n=1 Tax=unclassified Prosthecochloris TaxID=2632826 RepID=UPI00223D9744|nr:MULTISPECIES: helix-turn-helix transcriptional regulator [unclassified Prosthecochloris]UZJ37356.1 helix-turn-helix domain-containing protein [Prosthecochloris sp. SCSIO W1103]